MNDLAAYFSQQTAEDEKKRQDALNNAPSERANRRIEFPGRYVVKVGEFVWFDKKDPTHPIATPSPEVKISRKGALLLNISLQVCDKGTNMVAPGSSIFHTITLNPSKGADEKKFENTFKFMKPQMAALLGHDKISITEPWLKENCSIEFEDVNGKIVITKHHKLIKQVYATVDIVADQNNKPKLKVVNIIKLMPGDKSITRKYTEDEEKQMSKTGGVSTETPSDPGDISPAEETNSKSSSQAGANIDTSKVMRTEEDF
jgi:hypothetical protein